MDLSVRDLFFVLSLLTLLVHCVKCNQYDAHLEDNEFAEFEEFDEGKFFFFFNFNCKEQCLLDLLNMFSLFNQNYLYLPVYNFCFWYEFDICSTDISIQECMKEYCVVPICSFLM